MSLSPSPASFNGTYAAFDGYNCYIGHGAAVDIDVKPISGLTSEQCLARCNADDACSCAQYTEKGNAHVPAGSCWKRGDCTVRVFRQKCFTLEDAFGSHTCSLEALACV
jgi:hypothetical protein